MKQKRHWLFSWKWAALIFMLCLHSEKGIHKIDFIEDELSMRFKKYEKTKNVFPRGYSIHGIDISKHNGEVWWAKIKDAVLDSNKIQFVFIKSTEGMFFRDREFNDNWQSARRYNLTRGSYHFFRPSFNANFQAWNYIIHNRLKKGDLPPVLDLESSEGLSDMEVALMCKKWLKIVERHYAVKPIIYTNIKFYQRIVKGRLDEYPLWIAQYDQSKPRIDSSSQWTFWQHSDKGRIKGINEAVDLNVFNGDSIAFRKICLQ
ncbi:MAG: glycoside hydrolase family 25 protein [Saprospiraceae bacterium]